MPPSNFGRAISCIAALQGMGQLDLFLALFGMAPLDAGRIEIDGKPRILASPRDAVAAHIGISLFPRSENGGPGAQALWP